MGTHKHHDKNASTNRVRGERYPYCSICGVELGKENTYKRSQGKCKSCLDVYNKNYRLQAAYGMTLQEKQAMIENAGGVCEI
jgi:hypothetical protein